MFNLQQLILWLFYRVIQIYIVYSEVDYSYLLLSLLQGLIFNYCLLG